MTGARADLQYKQSAVTEDGVKEEARLFQSARRNNLTQHAAVQKQARARAIVGGEHLRKAKLRRDNDGTRHLF